MEYSNKVLKFFLNCELSYLNYFNVLAHNIIWFRLGLPSHPIRHLNRYFPMSIFFDFLFCTNLVTKCRDGETNHLYVKPSKIIWICVEIVDNVDWIHFILIQDWRSAKSISLSTPVNLFADRFWFRQFYQREVRTTPFVYILVIYPIYHETNQCFCLIGS